MTELCWVEVCTVFSCLYLLPFSGDLERPMKSDLGRIRFERFGSEVSFGTLSLACWECDFMGTFSCVPVLKESKVPEPG